MSMCTDSGGSQYNNGFMASAAFKWNLNTSQWTRLSSYPSQAGGAKTIYDPASGNIFVTMNDALVGHFYRTGSDTWSGAKNYSGNGFPFNSLGAWDSSRGRGIIVGDRETSVVSIDFSAETVSVSNFNPSGATEIFDRDGISAVYDPVVDAYWLFGGDENSPGWNRLYQMSADTWNVTSTTLTGDNISRSSGMIGSWGRYVLMPDWRALGLVANETAPAIVIRLPGQAAPRPKEPTDLTAE